MNQFLVFVVKARIKLIAYILQNVVEMIDVLRVKIIWSEVANPAKPPG